MLVLGIEMQFALSCLYLSVVKCKCVQKQHEDEAQVDKENIIGR